MFGVLKNYFMPDGSEDAVTEERLPPSLDKLREFFKNNRLADILPYESYDEANGLFYNRDSYGFAIEAISPLPGANENIAKVLEGIFSLSLPTGACVQTCLWASDAVLPMLTRWASRRKEDKSPDGEGKRHTNIFRSMARNRVRYLLKGAKKSLLQYEPFLVRNYRLVISVTFPGNHTDEAHLHQVRLIRDGFRGTLKSAHLPVVDVNADGLIEIIDEIINPRETHRRQAPTWDEGKSISDQVVCGSTFLNVSKDGLRLNDRDVRCLSVRSYPQQMPLWIMGNLIGDPVQTALQIPCPFLLTLCVEILDQEVQRRGAEIKSIKATKTQQSPAARLVPDVHERKNDWDHVQTAYATGKGLVRLSHHLVLFAQFGEGALAEQAAASLYRSNSWEMQNDTFVQIQSLLAALPMTISKSMFADLTTLGRASRKTTTNAANMMPLLAEWKGTSTPTLLTIGRRGQIQYTDVFDNRSGNYNLAVVAGSGSGKSVLFNEIAYSYVSTGGRAWIIDNGRSYQNSCSLLGGKFIEFTPEARICVNPFTHVDKLSEDEIDTLKPLIAQMAVSSRKTDDLENSFIEQAILSAWNVHGPRTTISPIAEWLNKHHDSRAVDLGEMLYPFTKKGVYARFFEGDSTLDFDNPLIVLELETLKNKRDLQSVIMLIVMFQVQQAMYHSDLETIKKGLRSQRKICLFDEAWDLFGEGSAAKFLEYGYRRVRKFGGAFGTATQSINDYFNHTAARAAYENSDWLFLLRQRQESIQGLSQSGRLSMDEHMKYLLTSLTTVEGKYSDMMICGPGGYSVGRLVLDPFSEKLYSTKPEEFERIQLLRSQGLSVADAVERLISEAH